jgi:hypothetical protein
MSKSKNVANILSEITSFIENKESGEKMVLDLELAGKERFVIYNHLQAKEIYYTKKEKLIESTKIIELIVYKSNPQKLEQKIIELEPAEFVLTDKIVQSFKKYYKINLPVATTKYFEYYSKILNPYSNFIEKFLIFKTDLKNYNNDILKLSTIIENTMIKISNYVSTHADFIDFKKCKFDNEITYRNQSIYKSKTSLYSTNNHNKKFISIDIVKANYTILKHYYPNLFNKTNTWIEFVNSFFTDDEKKISTLHAAKFIRERLFGELSITEKIKYLAEYFIKQIAERYSIDEKNIVFLSGDELVIHYDEELYKSLSKNYNNDFYRIDAFLLKKLGKNDFYVKEYINTKKTEMKCVPNDFLMQAIKYYENKEITEIDRKFTTNTSMVATFDEALVF